MINIRYSLRAPEEKYKAGITNLQESLERPLDINGFTLLLCTAGTAIVSANFQKRIIKKGDVIFLFTDVVFITLKTSKAFSAEYISLSDETIEEVYYKITSVPFWDFMYENPICHTSEKQYEQLYIWYRQTKWMIEECMEECLLTLLRNNVYNLLTTIDCEVKKNFSTLHSQSKKDRGWVILGQFTTLLNRHCHERREVNFYAEELCITPDYLYKLTNKAFHLTPKGIIDQQIIIEIKTYLSCTDMSVKNIAEVLNFEDSSYMCRFFRRLTGMSPIDYRNNR